MLGSFKIGTAFGITVRVHWLFLVLFAYGVMRPQWMRVGEGAQGSLAVALLLTMMFGIVFLHELGHSLVARRFGIRVYDITFWPLGGMARMSEMPEKPGVELAIAIAGPAVNFALAALALPLVVWSSFEGAFHPGSQALGWTARMSVLFLWFNLAMGVFNLVPAFPMDGGRVLRALLARSRPWEVATERAVSIGRGFALAMIVSWPLFRPVSSMLPLIGLFVWFASGRELASLRARRAREAAAEGPGGGVRGLSTEDIERMERFRGPLRQYKDADSSRDNGPN